MLSPLTKSASDSERPANKAQIWEFTRTLKRGPTYRKIEPGDLRYLYAAYKLGALIGLGVPGYLSPDEFGVFIDKKISTSCHMAWALLIGGKPAGFVLGAWSPAVRQVLEIVLVVWMPWASKRNIIESAVNFIAEIKKEYRCMGYALPEHKGLYEVAARHGLVRRIGTSYNAIPGRPTAMFESIHRSKS
jgi:hypothetical protein